MASGPGTCTYFNDRAGNHDRDQRVQPRPGPRGAANDRRPRSASRPRSSPRSTASTRASSRSRSSRTRRSSASRPRLRARRSWSTRSTPTPAPARWAFAPSPPAADRPPVAQQDVIRTGLHLQAGRRRRWSGGSADPGRTRRRFATPASRWPRPSSQGRRRTPTRSRSSSTTSSPRAPASTTAPGRANAEPATGSVRPAPLVDVRERVRGRAAAPRPDLPGRRLQLLHRRRTRCRSSTTAGLRGRSSPTPTGEETYSFSGLSGSLDHVLGNAAAMDDGHRRRRLEHQRRRVGRLPVQPLQLQRRRSFFDGTVPFAASDHDPEIVGIDLADGPRHRRRPDPRHQRLPRPDLTNNPATPRPAPP